MVDSRLSDDLHRYRVKPVLLYRGHPCNSGDAFCQVLELPPFLARMGGRSGGLGLWISPVFCLLPVSAHIPAREIFEHSSCIRLNDAVFRD